LTGLFTKNNNNNPFDNIFEEIEKEGNEKLKHLIGKHYRFKEKFDDEYFTYIRVIKIEKTHPMIDRFSFGYYSFDESVQIVRINIDAEKLSHMEEISQEEFSKGIEPVLAILNLKEKEN